ncbi:unnamed protein product, partial [marine sediment metagenome]
TKFKKGEIDMCSYSIGKEIITKLKEDENFVIEGFYCP